MRLFEDEEEKKLPSLPAVKPGEDIIINDIPFLGKAIFKSVLIQYKGNIPNPLYTEKTNTVRHYYNRENPNRKSKDKLKLNLISFFKNNPDLFIDEILDLELGKFILKLKQDGNDGYKTLVHGFGDEDEYVSFKIKNLPEGKGLYIWVADNTPKYIGIASSDSGGLRNRIDREYGSVTAYKCNIDGHTQTCESNAKLRDEFNAKRNVALYVFPIDVEVYKNNPEFMEYMNNNFKFKGTNVDKNVLEVFEKFIIKKHNFKDGWNKRLEENFVSRFKVLAGIK
jgi:hypothetical protein|tara:strand:- start:290 stop:1132 length:843 start_codon:yes stop_codon:yes gene_type:complete